MYEIGQKVVCVKTHSKGVVKDGEIYVVKNIKVDCCGMLSLDVGFKEINGVSVGSKVWCCEWKHLNIEDGIWWLGAELFRPIDDLYNTEIEELMNEVNERVPFSI